MQQASLENTKEYCNVLVNLDMEIKLKVKIGTYSTSFSTIEPSLTSPDVSACMTLPFGN